MWSDSHFSVSHTHIRYDSKRQKWKKKVQQSCKMLAEMCCPTIESIEWNAIICSEGSGAQVSERTHIPPDVWHYGMIGSRAHIFDSGFPMVDNTYAAAPFT